MKCAQKISGAGRGNVQNSYKDTVEEIMDFHRAGCMLLTTSFNYLEV